MSRRVEHDGRGTLEVRFPFDRDLVTRIKSLPSRRWNASKRFWSVPESDVVPLVDLLREDGFGFDEATVERYVRNGGTATLKASSSPATPSLPLFDAATPTTTRRGGPAPGDSEDFTVSGLNRKVQQVLLAAFPSGVWLIGEISGFNKSAHRRHVGFQLVELDDDGGKVSEVSATLFESTRREIEQALERAGRPFTLEDEITVRMNVRVELYVPWGSYRVIVEGIDIQYTLGEAARRREEIIRRLTEEGLTDRNTALPLPALPLRVGLITSLGSDAYNDVLRTLQESGFAFRLTAHGARVQGRQTEPSVLNALEWFRERARRFDVLLICRGGGSRTDLAWFDSERLGREVADFPLPVLVGIGHEQDHSVLDAVARRAKTPTAAAAALVEQVRAGRERVQQTWSAIIEAARASVEDEGGLGDERARRLAVASAHLVDRERARLDNQRHRAAMAARALTASASERLTRWVSLIPRAATSHLERRRQQTETTLRSVVRSAGHEVERASERVERLTGQVAPRAIRAVTQAHDSLEARRRRLVLSDPRRVVERGYSILRRVGGAVVTDAADVPTGTELEAELRRGKLRLRSAGRMGHPAHEETGG